MIEQMLAKEGLAIVIPIVAIVFGTLIALVSIVINGIRSIMVGRAREQTRRELAAYVAEGTLDPDKAVAIIQAGGGSEACATMRGKA